MYDDKTIARFWKYVDRSGDCWLWTGGIGKRSTRLLFSFRDQTLHAKRVSYQLHTGNDPGESWIDQTCGNRLCVRPEHLKLHERRTYKPTRKSIEARFWSKVDKTGDCWLWIGSRMGNEGYGVFRINGRAHYAHRVAYKLTFGDIPAGMHVLHDCPTGDTPRCVNPAHLWLGSHSANIADREAKGRGSQFQRKLSDRQVAAMRRKYAAGGISCGQLAVDFNITPQYAWQIIAGRSRPDHRYQPPKWQQNKAA